MNRPKLRQVNVGTLTHINPLVVVVNTYLSSNFKLADGKKERVDISFCFFTKTKRSWSPEQTLYSALIQELDLD